MRACIHLVLSCLHCVSVIHTRQMIVYLKVCLCYCHSNGEGATLVSRESEVIVCVGVCYDSGGRLWLSVLCWLVLRHRLMNKGQSAGSLYAPVQRHVIWVQPLSRVWPLIVLHIALAMTSQGGASTKPKPNPSK